MGRVQGRRAESPARTRRSGHQGPRQRVIALAHHARQIRLLRLRFVLVVELGLRPHNGILRLAPADCSAPTRSTGSDDGPRPAPAWSPPSNARSPTHATSLSLCSGWSQIRNRSARLTDLGAANECGLAVAPGHDRRGPTGVAGSGEVGSGRRGDSRGEPTSPRATANWARNHCASNHRYSASPLSSSTCRRRVSTCSARSAFAGGVRHVGGLGSASSAFRAAGRTASSSIRRSCTVSHRLCTVSFRLRTRPDSISTASAEFRGVMRMR